MPELQVSALVNAPGWRYRPIRAHRLEQFAAAMRAGEPFSPLVAFRARDGDGNRLPGRYWIVDGRHRLAARRMVGRDTVDVDILDDGLRDAVMYACSASTIPELAGANDDGRRVAGRRRRRSLGPSHPKPLEHGKQPVAPSPRQGQPARQKTRRRLGRRLPRKPHHMLKLFTRFPWGRGAADAGRRRFAALSGKQGPALVCLAPKGT